MANSKFKFIFADSTVSLIESENFRDAAIVAVANRIRGNKDRTVCGAWAKDGDAWKHVAQDTVSINLAAK